MSDVQRLGYQRMQPVQAHTAPVHVHNNSVALSSIHVDELRFHPGVTGGAAGLALPDLLGTQKPVPNSELTRIGMESSVPSFSNGKLKAGPHTDSPWQMHGASPQLSTSRNSNPQDSGSSCGPAPHTQRTQSIPARTSPYTTPPPDPPANRTLPASTAAPAPLTNTLSQLLDMASQQYQMQLNDRVDFSRYPSLMVNGDFPMTWSFVDRPFGSSLPSTMSLGLPLQLGSRGGDGLSSPAVSLVLPDVATILSGLEGEALAADSCSHSGLDRQRAEYGGVPI
jgi:hypothetical protein